MSATTHRVALVTGAARGIGREIALTLAGRGMAVAVCDLAPEVKATAAAIQALGVPAAAALADVSQEADVARAAAELTASLGPVDVLGNNAGIFYNKSLVDLNVAEWDRSFAVNVRGAFLFCKQLVPGMQERRRGLVVNLSSIWGVKGGPDRIAYVASKHAVIGLTRGLAEECRPYRVRVNAVCPGPVDTGMNAGWQGDKGSWMQPRHVADVVGFLCDETADGITGAAIEVFGWGRPAGL